MTTGVDFSEAGGVAVIRLNPPGVLNAIDLETARALRSAIIAAERSPTSRCVLQPQPARQRSAFVERVSTSGFVERLRMFVDRRRPAFVGA